MGGLQDFSVRPLVPLNLVWVWGLRVLGQGLTIILIRIWWIFHLDLMNLDAEFT